MVNTRKPREGREGEEPTLTRDPVTGEITPAVVREPVTGDIVPAPPEPPPEVIIPPPEADVERLPGESDQDFQRRRDELARRRRR